MLWGEAKDQSFLSTNILVSILNNEAEMNSILSLNSYELIVSGRTWGDIPNT